MSTPGPSEVPEGRGAAGARGGPGTRGPQAPARSPDSMSGPGAALQRPFCRTPQPSRPPAPPGAPQAGLPAARVPPPLPRRGNSRVSPAPERAAGWSARRPQAPPGGPGGRTRREPPGAYSRRRRRTGRTLTSACRTEPPAPPRGPRPRPAGAPGSCLRPRVFARRTLPDPAWPGSASLSPLGPPGWGRTLAGMPSCPTPCSAPPARAGHPLRRCPRPGPQRTRKPTLGALIARFKAAENREMWTPCQAHREISRDVWERAGFATSGNPARGDAGGVPGAIRLGRGPRDGGGQGGLFRARCPPPSQSALSPSAFLP